MLEYIDGVFAVPKAYYGLLIGIGFCIYYLCEVVHAPLFVCAHGPFRTFLERHVPVVKSKYWPTLWCFEPRAQTILASLLRSRILPRIPYRREILTLSDGGEVALDWAEDHCPSTSPIVVVLPGLTGGSQSEYVRCLVTSAKNIGVRCVIFNNRGLGGVGLKTPRTYCACKCDDLAEVLNHVKRLHPNVPLGAVGISLGGLILGNYLAQESAAAKSKLKAALVISVPWNASKGMRNIERPYLNLMMNRHLTESLCNTIEKHRYSMDFRDIDINNVLECKTIREFDSHFTVKQFGYKDAEDYYGNATLHDKIHLIHVPLLCLSAADDPFQPLEAIPLKEISEANNLAILVTSRGGHIAFLEGLWPIKKEQYIGKVFGQYFAAIFNVGLEEDSQL